MLANFHTHSTFCDGKNTPEEIVLAALEKGFVSIGFSSHGYTPYDLRYCMKDTEVNLYAYCRIFFERIAKKAELCYNHMDKTKQSLSFGISVESIVAQTGG